MGAPTSTVVCAVLVSASQGHSGVRGHPEKGNPSHEGEGAAALRGATGKPGAALLGEEGGIIVHIRKAVPQLNTELLFTSS